MLWIRDGNVAIFPHDYRGGADMIPGILQIKLHSWSKITPVFTQTIPNVRLPNYEIVSRFLTNFLLIYRCTEMRRSNGKNR